VNVCSYRKKCISFFVLHFTGFYSHATTVHSKQRQTAKAKGQTTRKKKCLPRRTREEERQATSETERRKKKDL